jgi:hypothetical protein
MKPIKIQALIKPSKYVCGIFLSITTYDQGGQGESIEEAEESAMGMTTLKLSDEKKRLQKPLPKPIKQLESIDEVTEYFSKHIPEGSSVVKGNTKIQEPIYGLPKLIFEFYETRLE